jgi:hypothetical protein
MVVIEPEIRSWNPTVRIETTDFRNFLDWNVSPLASSEKWRKAPGFLSVKSLWICLFLGR